MPTFLLANSAFFLHLYYSPRQSLTDRKKIKTTKFLDTFLHKFTLLTDIKSDTKRNVSFLENIFLYNFLMLW